MPRDRLTIVRMPTPREREMRSLLAQLDNSALSTRDFADLHDMSVMTIY